MFASRRVQQVAALPFRVTNHRVELLLVTSRTHGRWIVPKGWPQSGVTLAESAEQEAWEEAGVRGQLIHRPVGRYGYPKRMRAGYEVPSGIVVYPLLVTEESPDWPERGERERAWRELADAAQIVDERGLARLIARLARNDGAKLRQLAAKLGLGKPATR